MEQSRSDVPIYLFSSNITRLYALDALNTVCLPHGWIVHFRYECQYVDPVLWQAARESPRTIDGHHPLRGRDAIITFVDQIETTERSAGPRTFKVKNVIPMRLGTIQHVKIDGSIVHFYFSLGDFMSYDDPETGPAEKEQLLRVALTDPKSGQSKTPWDRFFASCGTVPVRFTPLHEDRIRAFQQLVRILSGRGFEPDETMFSLFLGLRQLEEGKPVEQLTPVPIRSGPMPFQSGYEVEEGKSYAFEITTFHTSALNPTYFAEAAVKLSLDTARFDQLDRTSAPVRSRYDRFVLPVGVRRRNRSEWTSVTLHGVSGVVETKSSEPELAALPPFLAPEWIVPIRINVERWRKLGIEAICESLAVSGTAAIGALLALDRDGFPTLSIAIAVVVLLVGVAGRLYFSRLS